METPTVNKPENPADNLVELVDALAAIVVTPEKIATNSISMTTSDGSVITY